MLYGAFSHDTRPRSIGMAYLYWFFLGGFGTHKFYLGQPGMGVLYIFTLGLFGFGHLYDLFTIPAQVRRANEAMPVGRGSAAVSPGKASSRWFAPEEDRPAPSEDAMDAMYARYAAEQKAAAEPVRVHAGRAQAFAQRPVFGRRA